MYVFIYVYIYIFTLTNLLTYYLYLFRANFIFFCTGKPRHFLVLFSSIRLPRIKTIKKVENS